MHNSDQVRDFFRKMADGLVLNHDTRNYAGNIATDDRRAQEKTAVDLSRKFADFGVGLPPLAHG